MSSLKDMAWCLFACFERNVKLGMDPKKLPERIGVLEQESYLKAIIKPLKCQ